MERSMYLKSGEQEDISDIARRVAHISVSAIKQMPVLAAKVEGCISLGQGIPSFNTPLFIREAVRQALLDDDSIGKYSLQPGMPELKAQIAQRLARETGNTAIDPETELVVTCGGMEGLAAVMSSIVDRDDEVIVMAPGYAPHIEQILFAEGVPVFVPLIEEDGWTLDIEAVRAAITPKTKAMIVASPINPTGTLLSETQLRELAAIALEHNIYVIADEAYDFLVFDNDTHFSLASIPELKPKLISTYSFSKMFCMTGWRVGYVYASKRIIDQILKVHDAFAICAPTISQFAALAGLRACNGVDGEGDVAIRELSAALQKRRDLTCAHLDRMPQLFSYQRPHGSYYLLPRIVPDISGADLALRLLYEAKVITVPGNGFGPTSDRHIRLSFGGSDQDIVTAMERIEHWASQNGYAA